MRQSELILLKNGRAKRPKNVNLIRQKDEPGNVIGVRYYHRHGGRIHGDLNSDEFLENYLKLQKGRVPKSERRLYDLITEYLTSPEYEKLAMGSKTKYRQALDAVRERFNFVKNSDLGEDWLVQEIFDWRDSMRNTPTKANFYIGVLKSVFSRAQKRRKIKINPTHTVDFLKTTGRTNKVWSPKQLEVFCEVAPPRVRDIFLAALFTGQRNADVRKMEWSDYDGDWLHVKQSKTVAGENLPDFNLQPLKQVLDIQPKIAPTIFTNQSGVAWSASRLHKVMSPCREKANAVDLHWHDLRGTLVSMLTDACCSEIQIAAITGHAIIKSQVGGYLNIGQNLAIEAYAKLHSMLGQNPNNYFHINI